MVVSANQRSVERSVAVLGWLHLLYGAALTAVASLWTVSNMLAQMFSHLDERVFYFEPISLLVGGLLVFGSALPSMVAGYGLLDRAAWSQSFAKRVSLVNMLVFPAGTLLGAWTYFVLRCPVTEKILGPAYTTVSRPAA